MTPAGRPTIGKQISVALPQEHRDRLNAIAEAKEAKLSDVVRRAVADWLGPDPAAAHIRAFIADAHEHAHEWVSEDTWPYEPLRYGHEDAQEAAHAMWEASQILRLHCREWGDADLTPVYEAIALADSGHGGNGREWESALEALARMVRGTECECEWVSVHIDIVHWTLSISVGGAWGAMTNTTYEWNVMGHVRGRVITKEPDVWSDAGRLILGQTSGWEMDDLWVMPAPRVEPALTHLRERGCSTDALAHPLALWEHERRAAAGT